MADSPVGPYVTFRDAELRDAFMKGMASTRDFTDISVGDREQEVAVGEEEGSGLRQDITVAKRGPWEPLGIEVEGVHVGRVASSAAAHRAGLQEGDKILSIDGKEVTHHDEVVGILRGGAKEADIITFGVERQPQSVDKPLARQDSENPLVPEAAPQSGRNEASYSTERSPQRTWSRLDNFASQRQTVLRAVLVGLAGLVSLLLYVFSTEDGACQRELSTWMVLNIIVLAVLFAFTVCSSKAIVRSCCSSIEVYPTKLSCVVTTVTCVYSLLWVAIEVTLLTDSSRDSCGSAFTAAAGTTATLFIVGGVYIIYFTEMCTSTADDEPDALHYRYYEPPPGSNKVVGRVLG